jgi:hypothetical protein
MFAVPSNASDGLVARSRAAARSRPIADAEDAPRGHQATGSIAFGARVEDRHVRQRLGVVDALDREALRIAPG